MLMSRTDPPSTVDDTSHGSWIPNWPGKIVVTLASTSNAEVGILVNESGKRSLELLTSPQRTFRGPVDVPRPRDEPCLVSGDAPSNSLAATNDALSGRQRDVLKLIVQGMSNKEMARALNLAEGTVKIHVAALFHKLGVHRRAAVAIAAARALSVPA